MFISTQQFSAKPWIALLLLTGLLFPRMQAQTNDPQALSLQQCLDYALKHSSSVLNAETDQAIANAKVMEILGAGLPQVNLNGNSTYFIKFPTTVIPANAFNPLAPAGTYAALKFGMPMSASGGIDVSQLLISGEWFVGLKASKTYRELASKNVVRTEIDVINQVTKGYYLALVNKERLKLVDANIVRVEKLLNDTKAMNTQGFAEKMDVDRLTVTFNNLKTDQQKLLNLTEVSMFLLKYQMGMPVHNDLTLTDKIRKEDLMKNISPEILYENRVEMKLMMMQRKMNHLDIRRYQASYLPTLVAVGNNSMQAYRSTFGNIFTEPATGKWYPNFSVGARLTVPIFAGFSKSSRVKQARLTESKTDRDIANLKNAIDLEIATARANFTNNLNNLDAQERNMELAGEVARLAKIKYEQGVGSNLEVVTAEADYKTAQTNYMNTLFDALTSQVDLRKATGTLHFNQ